MQEQQAGGSKKMLKSIGLNSLLVLIFALILTVSCSDDDDNPVDPDPNLGDITGDELTDAQLTFVVDEAMSSNAQTGLSVTLGLKQTLTTGTLQALTVVNSEEGEIYHTLAQPPEGWSGPEAGWYTYTGDLLPFDVYKVRLTPDIWEDAHAGELLSRIEYHIEWNEDNQGVVTSSTSDYMAEVNGDRTMMNGSIELAADTAEEIEGQTVSYQETSFTTFTDVSLLEDNLSSRFLTTRSFVLVDPMSEIYEVAISTQFDFDTDGSGSGSGAIAGEDYVRFAFIAEALGEIRGRYTLKRDNWEIPYLVVLTYDDSVNPTPGDITGDDMTEDQLTVVVESGMISSLQYSILITNGFRRTFTDGIFWSVDTIDNGSSKTYSIVAEPTEGWDGPDADGWYFKTNALDNQELLVRLTPDIWDDAHSDDDLNRVEFREFWFYDDFGNLMTVTYDYWSQINEDRTELDGEIHITGDVEIRLGDETISYEHTSFCVFDEIALMEGNYSGNYSTVMLYPLMDNQGEYVMVALSTHFEFNADRTGDGIGMISGEEYARFTFTNANNIYMVPR